MPLTPSAPDSEAKSSEDAPAPKSPSVRTFLFGVGRTRAMGSNGLAAASAGWVLVGCIAFGFVVGSWLDKHFGTSYWMPVLVLVGVAAGFRELFMTVSQVSNFKSTPQKPNTVSGAPSTQVKATAIQQTVASNEAARMEKPAAPQRLFSVPPPPTASFDKNGTTATAGETREPSREDVLKALLGDEDEAAPDDETT